MIINEIRKCMDAYSMDIDCRHMTLLGDVMTFRCAREAQPALSSRSLLPGSPKVVLQVDFFATTFLPASLREA